MNKKKITPNSVYREYEKAERYNDSIDLYENVKKNENFYIGNQWVGINAPDIDKPTFNFLKRVVSYFISQIVSDDIAVQFRAKQDNEETRVCCEIFKNEVDRIIEKTKAKTKARKMLRNAAVDGDGCFYFYYDTVSEDIAIELTDNTKVLFGNPHNDDVQSQDRIIVVQRLTLEKVRKTAESYGVQEDEIENIKPDHERFYGEEEDFDDELVTVLTRFWREKGTIHYVKCTKEVMLKEDTDTEYRLYPIAWMNWEDVKSSYHGQSCITGLIPNQIFVNKLLAMSMVHHKTMAFPKIVYDMTKFPNGWDNAVGQAIGVVGGVGDAVMQSTKPSDMSQQAINLVDTTIAYSKELMGASDAALGNIKPENTSAIIATQKASAAPLELQRQAYYQFWEDCVLIMLEIMRVDFGIRTVTVNNFDEYGEESSVSYEFNFDAEDYDDMQLMVDIGASAYWSEIAQAQTADSMLVNGIFTDPIMYLEAIPDHVIKNKNKIIAKLRAQKIREAQTIANQGTEEQDMGNNPNYIKDDGTERLATKMKTVAEMAGDM